LVRPGGAVGLPWVAFLVGGPGVTVGVVVVGVGVMVTEVVGVVVLTVGVGVGVGLVAGLFGCVEGEGVLTSAFTGRSEDSGVLGSSGVSTVFGGAGFTRGAGCCLAASGSGIKGVSTLGPPSTLLTSSTTYPTTGTATSAPSRRILR
jgi:hypothetical protein